MQVVSSLAYVIDNRGKYFAFRNSVRYVCTYTLYLFCESWTNSGICMIRNPDNVGQKLVADSVYVHTMSHVVAIHGANNLHYVVLLLLLCTKDD